MKHKTRWACKTCQTVYSCMRPRVGICKRCREPQISVQKCREHVSCYWIGGEAKKHRDAVLPTNPKVLAHMLKRQKQNMTQSKKSAAETWMFEKLRTTGLKWHRNAICGGRLYDFWNVRKGIAVEVDGTEHVECYDGKRDEADLKRHCIYVFRVRNFNEQDAEEVLGLIKAESSWDARKNAKRSS